MSRIQHKFDCVECGAPLMQLASNQSVCSEGCGKLLPPIPTEAQRINNAKIMGLPNAHTVPGTIGVFDIDGVRHSHERRYTGKVSNKTKLKGDLKLAIWEGEVHVFTASSGSDDNG